MIKRLYADGSAADEMDQTRFLIKRVADQISMRIGNTLGPGGRNYMTPLGITNDGVSILKEMRFSDERDDSIADAFDEVARRQDEDAGDGTTTATLLTATLAKVVLDDVPDIAVPIPGGKTVMGIKRQLESELESALEVLEKQCDTEVDLEELKKVSRTAMEDHECSDLIAETVFEVGFNSNTMIKEGYSGKVEAKVVPGIHMPLKIETPAMFTNPTRREASHDEPIIIVANHVFEAYSDLNRFFESIVKGNVKVRPIVIIGKHFSTQFTAQIVGVSKKLGLPILLLNANGLKDDEFQDIAIYCGAKYVDTHPKEGKTVKDLVYADSGTCQTIVAGPEQTSFTGGGGIEAGTVAMRIADLKKLADEEQDLAVRSELLRRAAGLDGGVATLYVDAKTAVDRYYLKKKVEDAVNSCKAALEHGTVQGGGMTLKAVAEAVEGDYLPQVLPVVHERVQANAGGELEIGDDVRDSYWTVKCAMENAVAVAKILVTMEGVIAEPDLDVFDRLKERLDDA